MDEEILRFLIADSESTDRLAMAQAISKLGSHVEIEEVETCTDAINALTTRKFDCALLDYHFHDGDGQAIIRHIRKAGIDTPIIIFTAYGDEMVAVDVMKSGATDYVPKSNYSINLLVKRLDTIVRTYRAEQETKKAIAALRESESRFMSVARSNLIGIIFYTLDGRIIDANDAFLNNIGYSRDELAQGIINWKDITPVEYRDFDIGLLRNLRSAGVHEPYEKDFIKKNGKRFTAMVSASLLEGENDKGIAFIIDVSEKRRAESLVRFLSETGINLSSSLDYKATLDNLARIAVSKIADICVVDMLEDGMVRRMAAAHADPAKAGVAAELMKYTPGDNPRHPTMKVLRTGQTHYALTSTDQELLEFASDKPHANLLISLEIRSYIVLPLIARGRILGALSFLLTTDDRQYHETDILAFEELARRAAVAIDNARLFDAILRERKALEASEQRYRYLAEAVPQIVWTALPDGSADYFNQRWFDYTGLDYQTSLQRGWQQVVHPDDLAECLQRWKHSVETGDIYEIEYRFRRKGDGAYRWHLGRALPLRDRDGAVVKWFGTCTDIDDRKRTEEFQRFLAEAGAILSSSLNYLSTLSAVAKLAVPHIADWCAIDLLTNNTVKRVDAAHVDPSKIDLARRIYEKYPVDLNADSGVALVLRTGKAQMVREITTDLIDNSIVDDGLKQILKDLGLRSYICVPLVARGRILGAITFFTAESGRIYEDYDLALAQELAQRAALAVDNACLFLEAEERADRERLINQIGRRIRGLLDSSEIIEVTLNEIGLALGCSRATWSHYHSESGIMEVSSKQYCAKGILPLQRTISVYDIPSSIFQAFQDGSLIVVSDVLKDERLKSYVISNQPVSTRAYLSCPVFARGELIGVLTVHEQDNPRDWSQSEMAVLNAVASMLSLALETARLYAREHRVSEMLQSAFLSNIPENLPGMLVASAYHAGLEESHVGGDFYDAFLLPDGRVALVMADVSGKGLSAAVQTATVKYSLRAFAAEAAAPGLVLTRLNRLLNNEYSGLGEHFVTLFYCVFEPATGRFAYTSAGHETQVIKRNTGGSTLLPANGPILGIVENRYEQMVEYLNPGDMVILFTDGLTEARAASRQLLDLSRVVASIESAPADIDAVSMVSRLERLAIDWAENKPHDDLALLVIRHVPETVRFDNQLVIEFGSGLEPKLAEESGLKSSSKRGDGEYESLFDFTFPSIPDYAAEVRQVIAHWMETLGFEREPIEDFQTAVTEAVTNAVRHGSPQGANSQFYVKGYRTPEDAIVVDVGDNGPGLSTEPSDAVMPPPDSTSGRGLPLILALTDGVDTSMSANGHWIRLYKWRRRI